MTLPTIHSNGDRAEVLRDGFIDAYRAINAAVEAVTKVYPNGRNFYPQGHDAIAAASNEHVDRLRRLTSVSEEMLKLAEHCDRFTQK